MRGRVLLGTVLLTLATLLLAAGAIGAEELMVVEECQGDDWYINQSIIMAGGLECGVKDIFDGRPEELPEWKKFVESSNASHEGVGAWIINRDNIVIDCNGTTLNGIGYRHGDYSTRFRFGIFGYEYDNITIRNCRLNGFADAILLINSEGSTIHDNYAAGSDNGIVLDNTIQGYLETFERDVPHDSAPSNSHVFNNTLVQNLAGINLLFSDGNVVEDNLVLDSISNGIQVEGSSDNVFRNNYIAYSGRYAFHVYSESENNVMEDNILVDNDPRLRWQEQLNDHYEIDGEGCPKDDTEVWSDLVLPGNLYCNVADENEPGVLMVMRPNIEIDCNWTIFNGTGIVLPDVFKFAIFNNGHENVTVRHCGIERYGDGILFIDGGKSLITGNRGRDNSNAIVVDTLSDTIISNNDVRGSGKGHGNGRGILLLFADRNQVFNNVLKFSEDGIQIDGSHENIISWNHIEGTRRGVWIRSGEGHGNVMQFNEFEDNDIEVESYGEDSYTLTTKVDPRQQSILVMRGENKVLDKVVIDGDRIEMEKGTYQITFAADGMSSDFIEIKMDQDITVTSLLKQESLSQMPTLGASSDPAPPVPPTTTPDLGGGEEAKAASESDHGQRTEGSGNELVEERERERERDMTTFGIIAFVLIVGILIGLFLGQIRR